MPMKESIRRAREEYEAELTRQLMPYEQWIAENEEQTAGPADPAACGCTAVMTDARGEDAYVKLGAVTEKEAAEQEWVLLLKEGTEADPQAYRILSEAFRKDASVNIIYADEDLINAEGKRSEPWFKPDWSPDTFRSFFYFGSLLAIRRTYLCGYFKTASAGGIKTLWALTDALIEAGQTKPLHIPKILCHRTKPWEKVLPEELCHRRYPELMLPKVSVIIPSKDQPEILRRCIESLKKLSDYPEYELIVVDNGSSPENRSLIEALGEETGFRYIYEEEDFNFSRMCDRGAAAAAGELLLFLNDDTQILRPDWMRILAEQALQPHTGAVGAKLYYPRETEEEPWRIQHCGITNIALGPVHKLGGLPEREGEDYYHMRNRADADVLAVTAACLMIRRALFEEAGGFDESLPVAYNDVDLCFTLYERGFYNVVRMDAVLLHYESVSRGSDKSIGKRHRRERELAKLYRKHPKLYGRDPFYSPHLVQERLDVEYNLGYAQRFERPELRSKVRRLLKAPKPGRQGRLWRMLGTDPQLLKWVDDVGVRRRFAPDGSENTEYRIEGWASPARKPFYLYERFLLLSDGAGNSYEVSLFDKHRSDTDEILAQQEARGLAGFVARIPAGELPEGEYELFVCLRKKGSGRHFTACHDHTVIVKDGDMLPKVHELVGAGYCD